MSGIDERLGQLTPEQREALRLRLRERARRAPDVPAPPGEVPPVRLSLYFFPQARALAAPDYYGMLLRACEFADERGFHAAWFPERHFVDFGGSHPNPAVLAAAVAARTRRLRLRAGSVAAPLHHPVRIAEEWAVVDNLSGGRVGVSFASGWHPDDFVLAREPYDERKKTLMRTVEQVRRLWAGEHLAFPSTAGAPPRVAAQPRPVQPELPVWITAAGNPETFQAAGTAGYGVMTALLGQTLRQLRENVARYRAAWRDAGHPGPGDVVVMTHAHVSDEPGLEARLRPALHDYLSSYRAQTGGGDEHVLLEAAFQDYLAGPSLLGTPAKAAAVLARLAEAGADEVGCLIDFGLPAQDVLDGLPRLAALAPTARPASADGDRSQ
ncbi:MupA/Atu3671 family FMN-dependent luciferase-like monooxygenase [Streptomyces sp. NRRL S-31]|uniref:MupA/Atu3671 family FMN-dependent luciferase-like monooxygenase n=1 Tax=Streptomyces sp. NRRL S-31 TaxID=1463898 RepID=UPI0007C65665|nr:MupA/Atu3671 family FMN-dependent luciferase-like monooxygenase [Streptomyces sp. NRRL S-31]